MVREARRYWFPAKQRGWGWGPPVVWQGRAVLAIFFGLVFVGAVTVLPRQGAASFVLFSATLCALLMAVCWITGEPPGRRRP